MNKQKTKKGRGVEWTDYTWNVAGGCFHRCRWVMPDKSIAVCYAETTAEGVARAAYPEGFAHHYWHPERLEDPLKVQQPSKIFLDSMSDIMGAWVTDEQIEQVLDICRQAHWHTFQLLTKNPGRLLRVPGDIWPANVWVGGSSAPDEMNGHSLDMEQQRRYMDKALGTLICIDEAVTWMSFEPLSWDVSGIVAAHPGALDWAVIGAASNGKTYYQPNPRHVEKLLDVLAAQKVPVFFKGNLDWRPWREEFPVVTEAKGELQPTLF